MLAPARVSEPLVPAAFEQTAFGGSQVPFFSPEPERGPTYSASRHQQQQQQQGDPRC